MFKIRVNPRNDQLGLFFGNVAAEHGFYERVEPEAAGDGKQQGKNRDDGKQGTVCQGRGAYQHAVVQKLADGQDDDFDAGIEPSLYGRHFVFRNAPDAVAEKLQPIPDCCLFHKG